MRKILFLVAILFCFFSRAQDFAVKVEVVKNIKISEATRDSYVVPASEIWHVELTDGTKWQNNGGAGWVEETGGGVTDGDKGDITVASENWTIDNGVVTEAKLSTSVNASLDLADSALQSGDNVSELVNDAGYITDSDVGGIVAEGLQALTPNSTNTINHGLGYAPDASRIGITFFKDSAAASGSGSTINNITSTSFDITIGSETGLSAAWRIFGADMSTPISGSEIVSSIDTELGSTDWQDGGGTDDQTAAEVNITDSGNNYTGTTVETALAEVADSLAVKVNINPNSLPIELFRGDFAAAQAEYGVDPNTWPESLFAIIPDYPSDPIALSSITYDNSTSGMTADDGQEAIDELDARVDINDAKVSNATHTGDVTGATALTIANGVVGPDELASTAVTPGSYTNADITVDEDGRVTAASNGSGGGSSSDLDLTGNVLSLTNPTTPGNSVDLSIYLDNTDDQTASEVTVAGTPVNYTPDDTSVEGHFGGIDDALANAGVDTTVDFFLTSATNTGNDIGSSWIFTDPYSTYLTGVNNLGYWSINANGTVQSVALGNSSFRPWQNAVMSLGTTTARWTTGWFSSTVTATGFTTGGTSAQFLKANGSVDSNVYQTIPTVFQYSASQNTLLTHANGTVNFTGGTDLAYTIQPNGTVAHLVGTRLLINNEAVGGTGVTITSGGGVTLVGGSAVLATGEAAWAIQVTTDEWLIIKIN